MDLCVFECKFIALQVGSNGHAGGILPGSRRFSTPNINNIIIVYIFSVKKLGEFKFQFILINQVEHKWSELVWIPQHKEVWGVCVCVVCVCLCFNKWMTAVIQLPHSASYIKPSSYKDEITEDIHASSTVWVQPLVSTHCAKGWTSPNFLLEKSEKQGVFLSQVQMRTCVWKLHCVIFIDGCWEAGVSQSLEIRWEHSHSLCASQYLDFKAIDKLFLWTNPSVLACNPVCVELRPSSSLFPVRQG